MVVKAAEKPRNTFEDRRMSASSNTPKRGSVLIFIFPVIYLVIVGESATGLIEFVDPDTEETQSISFKARDVSVRAGLLEPGDKVHRRIVCINCISLTMRKFLQGGIS